MPPTVRNAYELVFGIQRLREEGREEKLLNRGQVAAPYIKLVALCLIAHKSGDPTRSMFLSTESVRD